MKYTMRASRSTLALLAVGLLGLSSCTDDTVGPGVGSGTEFEATIRGTKFSFDPNSSIDEPSYDASLNRADFSATIVGDTTRTLSIGFTHDIDNGSFPQTLTDADVSIVYQEKVNGVSTVYNCAIGSSACRITLNATDKQIVDGTFSATLSTMDTPVKTVSITQGTFSVKFSR